MIKQSTTLWSFSLFMIVFLFGCTNKDKSTSCKHEKDVVETYGLALIGEVPITYSPVEKVQIMISVPFGGGGYVVSASKFSNHFLVCKKTVSGIGMMRSYNEDCKAVLVNDYQNQWDKLINIVELKKNDTYKHYGINDMITCYVELFKEDSIKRIEDIPLCTTNKWPLLISKLILSDTIELKLPPCPQ